ncbi:MAG: DUF2927 domain-containing protein [Bacteroidota bacterium]
MIRYVQIGILAPLLFFTSISCSEEERQFAPFISDQTFQVLDDITGPYQIGVVQASDANDDPLTMRITGGNDLSLWGIDNKGNLVLNFGMELDALEVPVHVIEVSVSDGMETSIGQITIEVISARVSDPSDEFIDRVAEYFGEVALGFEFGSASRITRKWRDTIRFSITGNITAELQIELDRIVQELNSLITDGFYIDPEPVDDGNNVTMFFGTGEEFAERYSPAASFVNSNTGLFFVNFDQDDYISWATMWVDSRQLSGNAAKHILREELTQLLGLARDSNRYVDSIFYEQWSTVTMYTTLDREIIRMLYHPMMTTGLGLSASRQIIREIYESE